jgi:hypothetical protein
LDVIGEIMRGEFFEESPVCGACLGGVHVLCMKPIMNCAKPRGS